VGGVSAEALLEAEARGRNLYQKPGPELAP
jgi:hypothetical protein